jgi:hypothetical protein
MKNCVIYGAWLNNDRLNSLYLSTLAAHLSDCDFYVGFNHSTSKNFVADCLAKLPVVAHRTCEANLEVASDASAYQAALQCYKENKKEEYKNIYFIHNKGSSHYAPSYINDYIMKFLRSRDEIEQKLETYGGYCLYGDICNDVSGFWNNLIKDTATFPYEKPMDVIWWCTVYALRASVVDGYLKTVKEEFFKTKLDRYFFEASFPLISDKQGLLRYTKSWWNNTQKFTPELLQLKLKEYNDSNKLDRIMDT